MTPSEVKQFIAETALVVENTKDRICLSTKELTLSDAAQSLSFSGLSANDVKSVCIKVKKAGSPTDDTHLVRLTQALSDTPTTTHGMWFGNGDYFEITNKTNVANLKMIAAEAGIFSILTIEYYG